MGLISINHCKKPQQLEGDRFKPNTTHSVQQLGCMLSPGAHSAGSTMLDQMGEFLSSEETGEHGPVSLGLVRVCVSRCCCPLDPLTGAQQNIPTRIETVINLNSSGRRVLHTRQVQPELPWPPPMYTGLPQPPLWLPNQPMSVFPFLSSWQTFLAIVPAFVLSSLGATRAQNGVTDKVLPSPYSATTGFVSLPCVMVFKFLYLHWILLTWIDWRVLFVFSEDEGSQSSYAQLIHLLFLLCHFHCRVTSLNEKNLMISPKVYELTCC